MESVFLKLLKASDNCTTLSNSFWSLKVNSQIKVCFNIHVKTEAEKIEGKKTSCYTHARINEPPKCVLLLGGRQREESQLNYLSIFGSMSR